MSDPLQDDSIQTAMAPCCQQTSFPLLMACTANVKTVVANPIVYLTNLTHDILQTIIALDSPPHPDVVTNEVMRSPLSTAVIGFQAQCSSSTVEYSPPYSVVVGHRPMTPRSPITRPQLSHNMKDAVQEVAFSGAWRLYSNTSQFHFALFPLHISDFCDANPGRLLVSLHLSMSV